MANFIIEQMVKADLQDSPKNFVVLFIASAEKYADLDMTLLKVLLANNSHGIYITVNKPYNTLIDNFKSEGLDTKNLFFIDAITKRVSGEPEKHENVIYMSSPQSLTDLGIALEETSSKITHENKFLMLDSLSTLQIYNSAGVVANFIHFLVSKLRVLGMKGVFITLKEGTDQKITELMSQFGDRVFHINGEN